MVLVSWYYGSTLVKNMLFTEESRAKAWVTEFICSYKATDLDRFYTSYVGIEQ